MVQVALSSVTLLFLVALAATSPAPLTNSRGVVAVGDWSWEHWVETIIADPESALSVDEALEAAAKFAAAHENGSLEERQEQFLVCNDGKPSAWAPDAVTCINYLAGLNANCGTRTATAMCTAGNAQIVGSGSGAGEVSTNCNNVARTAGRIMDRCWRSDNTVQGGMPAYEQGAMWVYVSAPLI
ncbi:uncharacterized protein N0V96_009964 [Colletotrichum fioriniae]|uniref:uncharacterized protein n=1 Tax=Colletotrichum fioriniae TaxID=710243 RepID=UPI0023018482|nr:uncharacterized protein COL516b_010521 [Colletotrichum fioriniae]KAJ0297668.1 hypothetical protein COL516b_010521 [Colletotrichum fioriniae]KAJ3939970.1 hypothetical protein N0V96_009964 [Colletotrichum fioriniae]